MEDTDSMPLTDWDRICGGLATSRAKKKASAINGKLGGRPRGTVKRTLGEFLMRSKLRDSDYSWVERGIFPLTRAGGARSPRHQFGQFFGVKVPVGLGLGWLKTTSYNQKHAKRGTKINQLIRKFRSAARAAKKAGW